MTAVIEVTGLTKRYGGQAVVDDISFHVDAGEIFGILGRTARARPPRSSAWRAAQAATAARCDPRPGPADRPHRLHQRIGVQLQESQLQEKLKVREARAVRLLYPNPADWRELLEPGAWPEHAGPFGSMSS